MGRRAYTSPLKLHAQRAHRCAWLFMAALFSALMIHAPENSNAAGGGPPMITDDPGTPETGCWEINISFDTDIKSDEKEMETPLIDINYGLTERTQLRLEVPYLFTKEDDGGWHGRFGHVSPGIKYRFIDEENAGFSMSLYPQIAISTEEDVKNEYIFPVELETHLYGVTAGTDLRYIYINGEDDTIEHGLLLGYTVFNGFDVMGEFVYEIDAENFDSASGVLNFGIKYQIGRHIAFMASAGTGIFQSNCTHTDFISFTGFQIEM